MNNNRNQLIQDHALEVMPDAESILMEDRLWWVRGRKAIIREYMESARQRSEISTIMDIGCGSGGNLDVLKEFGRVIGVEPSETLANRARGRGVAEAIFQQDVLELDDCCNMDIFTMFDVLEHIKADKSFLSRLRNKADQRHYLLVSVPACQFLYGDHDRILHHHRRYTPNSLRSTLTESGYKVLQMNYFMFFLFPFALFVRMKDKLKAKLGNKITSVEVGDLPPILSALFVTTLKFEAFLSRYVRFPIGLWLFALAESNDQCKPLNKPGRTITE